MLTMNAMFLFMNLVKYNEYLVCSMVADGLALHDQGISHSTEYAPMLFQLFWG